MKVKMLKPYQRLSAGDVTEMNPPVASLLIGRGVAEEVKEVLPSMATKVAEFKKGKR